MIKSRFLAVVVLYNQKIFESSTLACLFSIDEICNGTVSLLVYDNSSKPSLFYDTDFSWTYIHNSSNGGLVEPYNTALNIQTDDHDWIILFDQDTIVPKNYFSALIDKINKADFDRVAAFAPNVYCNDRHVFPIHKLSLNVLNFALSKKINTINSGLAIQCKFLRGIGGFDRDFWLDYVDHWFCWVVYKNGYIIEQINLSLKHDLSVQNYNNLSDFRIKSILNGEFLFVSKSCGLFFRVIYLLQLLLRSTKQYFFVNNKSVCMLTAKQVIYAIKMWVFVK